MRSHAKASSAGSTQRQTTGLGRILRGADAGRAPSSGVKGSSVPSRRLLLCLPLALLLAALFAASAEAAPTTIAEYGAGAGQVENPAGTAVDQSTGDLYVAERNGFRVSKFDSAGNFLLAFGYGVADGVDRRTADLRARSQPAHHPVFFHQLQSFQRGRLEQEPHRPIRRGRPVHRRYLRQRELCTLPSSTLSGQLIFMVGKNVNKTKKAEAAFHPGRKRLLHRCERRRSAAEARAGPARTSSAANTLPSRSSPPATSGSATTTASSPSAPPAPRGRNSPLQRRPHGPLSPSTHPTTSMSKAPRLPASASSPAPERRRRANCWKRSTRRTTPARSPSTKPTTSTSAAASSPLSAAAAPTASRSSTPRAKSSPSSAPDR